MSHGWFTCPKCNIHYFDAEEHICPSRKAMTQSQSTDDLVKLAKVLRGMRLPAGFNVEALRKAADTIERLQRELKGAKINCKAHAKRAEDAGRELAARDKTIETLREDAERYRWLRRRIQVTAIHCRDEPIRMLPADIVRQSPESYATEVDAMIDKCAARSEVKP